MLTTQLLLVFAIGVTGLLDQWTAESVGFAGRVSPAWALVIGFTAYLALAMTFNGITQLIGIRGKVRDSSIVTLAGLFPRQRRQRVIFLMALTLNPFTEEIVFRGFLVHQLALMTESIPIGFFVGLAANLGMHIYQGRLALLFHVPFFALAFGLLYSALGLWGAIGAHIAGDLVPFLTMRQELAAYRQRHRK